MQKENPFFTKQLLVRLQTEPPMEIAYEAQVKSAEVGFDFATPRLALERLADEVRELAEALEEYEADNGSPDHLCDEVADVIFGVINVLRQAKLDVREVFSEGKIIPSTQEKVSLPNALKEIQNLFRAFERRFDLFESSGAEAKNMVPEAIALVQRAVDFLHTCGVQPDKVIRSNVNKYLIRCQFIEDKLQKEQKLWSDLSLDEIYAYRKQAKQTGV